MLALHGFRVFDADLISREVFNANLTAIEAAFGTVDRKIIGDRLFANSADRAALETIMHPAIRAEILRRCDEQESLGSRYFVDIPLFFERRSEYPFSLVAVVYAPREIAEARLIASRNLGVDRAKAMIASQLPIETKTALATWTIDNSGDIRALTKIVDRFVRTILDLKQR